MIYCNYPSIISAGMVELADTMDLGSIGQPCRFKSCYPHHRCEGICFGQVPFLLRGTVRRNANTSLTHLAGDSFRFPVCSAPKRPPRRIPVRLILPGAPLFHPFPVHTDNLRPFGKEYP